MRDFTDKSRFTVRSIPEVFEKIAVLVARFRARGVGLGGRMSREVLVNALFVHFDAQPPEVQAAMIEDGLARLRVLLAEGGDVPDAGPERRADVRVDDVTTREDDGSRRQHLG